MTRLPPWLFWRDKTAGNGQSLASPTRILARCVEGTRIVQFDRRRSIERDSEGVMNKFGVQPRSIPD